MTHLRPHSATLPHGHSHLATTQRHRPARHRLGTVAAARAAMSNEQYLHDWFAHQVELHTELLANIASAPAPMAHDHPMALRLSG